MRLPTNTLTHFPVQTGHHRVSFYDQFTVTRVASGRGHGGVDIGSVLGTRIYSATAGQVVNSCVIGGDTVPGAGYRNISGNYVVIVDSNGYFFYYFHMRDLPSVAPGESVAGGQMIGFMGNSGLTDRSSNAPVHLHFQSVNHVRRRSASAAWYADLVFPVRNLNNLDPYLELERLALRLPGATRGGGIVQGEHRDGVIINPTGESE